MSADEPTAGLAGTNLSGQLRIAETHYGEPLSELSNKHPLLLVFLRHFG